MASGDSCVAWVTKECIEISGSQLLTLLGTNFNCLTMQDAVVLCGV